MDELEFIKWYSGLSKKEQVSLSIVSLYLKDIIKDGVITKEDLTKKELTDEQLEKCKEYIMKKLEEDIKEVK